MDISIQESGANSKVIVKGDIEMMTIKEFKEKLLSFLMCLMEQMFL